MWWVISAFIVGTACLIASKLLIKQAKEKKEMILLNAWLDMKKSEWVRRGRSEDSWYRKMYDMEINEFYKYPSMNGGVAERHLNAINARKKLSKNATDHESKKRIAELEEELGIGRSSGK